MTDTTATTKTFTLDYPVDFGSEKTSSVTLRRPKGREVRKMQNAVGGQGDVSFEMLAQLAEREEGLFDEMDAGDVMKMMVWVKGVLGE